MENNAHFSHIHDGVHSLNLWWNSPWMWETWAPFIHALRVLKNFPNLKVFNELSLPYCINITTNYSYKWTCLALSFCIRKKRTKKWETEEFQIPTILFFPLSISDSRKRSCFPCDSRKPNKGSIFFHFLTLFFWLLQEIYEKNKSFYVLCSICSRNDWKTPLNFYVLCSIEINLLNLMYINFISFLFLFFLIFSATKHNFLFLFFSFFFFFYTFLCVLLKF